MDPHDPPHVFERFYQGRDKSQGMGAGLGLAWAMLGKPRLLILDEPINGLDPAGAREVRDLLRRLRDETGVTILLSSHILSEVEQLADRIGVIHEGRLLVEHDRIGEFGWVQPTRSDLIQRGSWDAAFLANQTLGVQLLLLGPMMLAVMGAQLLTAEYRQKTLKGSLPLPTSLAGVFAAKAVLGCVALGTALLLTAAVILLVPSLMGLPPSGSLTHAVLKDTGILWVTYLSFLHFAMSVGLISRDFVLPLAASAVVLVGGILAMQGGRNGAGNEACWQLCGPAIPCHRVGHGLQLMAQIQQPRRARDAGNR